MKLYTPNFFECTWAEQRTRETAAPTRVKNAQAKPMSEMVEGSGVATFVAEKEPTLTAFENSQKVPTWAP